ncbi:MULTISPECIES: LLM class flavin-dependent oxidoreductase [unclassified Beijerinckia]|uniref:LLM class flavin-dependent oxidoreductase n=1 Tax=unclassified Beijerinckia TaxID=2638183 RepID=UPI000894DB16|nr:MULTISPECIES: LLM class flavin-dependent oxidoreductase [unclassified Beijerinckia]MDH7797814.1 FMN-dependent oxidoreductase (nitrilotriacetate monooxygenase family) [Beijerinckia sp. GAS462]SEC99449.1 alkanesulfonate monooxygenase [Beijerinckia sp. 28-YEA-48]
MNKKMRLAAYFNPTGHHVASWRHPRAQRDAHQNIEHYVEIARTAERAKFDMIFLADGNATRDADIEAISRSVQFVAHFEPITLLSALAMVTKNIGLTATASTTYNEPYNLARKFASLDHISHGRAGWNLVTSGQPAEAKNFGRDGVKEHSERYSRAREFAEVVQGLWDSWDDDAFVRDAESGLFFEPDRMHHLNHKGEHFKVRGPLNVPRPPQGYPVMVQAGASDEGRELAAQYAEAIFSPHLNIPAAKAYYDDVKGRMTAYNRDPDHLKVLPGISVVVAESDDKAAEDFNTLQSLIHPIVGREILSTMLGGADLTPYPLDEPLPDLPLTNASRGHFESIMAMARAENLTIRQLGERCAGARGKNSIHGSVKKVADYMEEWFAANACDGFCVMPPYISGQHDDFCNMVIPELQKRGLFRKEYEGATLRENLGLPRPPSRHSAKRQKP